jgi:hypothetical protein
MDRLAEHLNEIVVGMTLETADSSVSKAGAELKDHLHWRFSKPLETVKFSIMKLSIVTLSIMKLSIMTLSIMTLSIMTLSIMALCILLNVIIPSDI